MMDDYSRYSLTTLEAFVRDGRLAAAELERRRHFVQVRYLSGSGNYTYRDPSGTLQVGDFVEVPVRELPVHHIGKVVALGRGCWTGEISEIKDVTAVFKRTTL